ncbi:MAG TPA: hypothetical protein VK509_13400 [Polyangiales bacterium]|nr:hypothetical protein [Polyangiales bacterium]
MMGRLRVRDLAVMLAWLGAAGWAMGCEREGQGAAAKRAETAAVPVARVARVPATTTGFDLAASERGALLAWARPRAQGGGIWLQLYDARGAVRGAPRRVAQTEAGGEVVELAAIAVGRRNGLAWVESSASESRTRALLLRPDEPTPPEPTRIAEGAKVAAASRTHLAIAASQERLRVLYADAPTACVDRSSAPCIGYGFSELGDGARGGSRPWLAVPQPCTRGVPSLAARDDRLYYAVCSTRAELPTTVAYSINVQTEYARADEVLRGCDPLGLLALDDGALLIADCGGVRRGVELTLAAQLPVERELAEREVVCSAGQARLRAGGFELALHGARERLESLLPDALAPPGARAVWTGRALLVAHPSPDGLELLALACAGNALKPVP